MKAWNNGHEQAQCSKDGDHDDDWHEMEREEEEAHKLTAPERRRRLIGSAGSASVPIKPPSLAWTSTFLAHCQ